MLAYEVREHWRCLLAYRPKSRVGVDPGQWHLQALGTTPEAALAAARRAAIERIASNPNYVPPTAGMTSGCEFRAELEFVHAQVFLIAEPED